jgi:hypothetical protein
VTRLAFLAAFGHALLSGDLSLIGNAVTCGVSLWVRAVQDTALGGSEGMAALTDPPAPPCVKPFSTTGPVLSAFWLILAKPAPRCLPQPPHSLWMPKR